MIDYKRMTDLLLKSFDIKKKGQSFIYDPVGSNQEWKLDNILKIKLNSRDADELKTYLNEYFKSQLGCATLRNFINAKSSGAYHHFLFQIGFQKVDVIDTQDFEMWYKPDLLDEYVVVGEIINDNNGDCANYRCDHYLKIERKEI